MLIVSALQTPPLFIEGVPRRGGGVSNEVRSNKVSKNSALRLETCSPAEGKGNSLLRRLWETKVSVVASNAHLALPLYKQRDSQLDAYN